MLHLLSRLRGELEASGLAAFASAEFLERVCCLVLAMALRLSGFESSIACTGHPVLNGA